MITVKNAYEIAKQKYIFQKLLSCLDFGSFYLFSFAPLLTSSSDGYLTGVIFDAVDKKTGRMFEYDISSDLDAFEKANPVEVKTFLDEIV